ncbi:uncharacterized protein GGS22DRAFT_104755 [Annulohypoxylon maeteangense]|uniref:uncharacterized protein n=1 Tax=Annulohypoxylon maeteangense TaxID=1927788 RepID=UPI0020082300|nr:uncharacterized protein GGS22DRAFT_104755 [Annulohypoxylon maeteangense]KAI0887122.1 hypothetical protein GGS22DRAFT_104755 [Annulohypoxylon maeteangense]
MHSTKEVALESGMEVAPDHAIPEVVPPQHTHYKGYDISQWQNDNGSEKRISGLRRETFWLLVTLCAVVSLALGLGMGLGLGLRNNNNVNNTGKDADSASISNANTLSASLTTSTSAHNSVAAESADSVTTATPTSTSTSSTRSSGTTSIASSTITSVVDSGCPDINGTTTSMSTNGINIIYRFYCNSDLTGTDQAALVTNSLDECVRLCDSLNWMEKRRDVGSVWNEKGVVGQKAGSCWCKGGSNIQVTAKSGIVVASALP